jgi:hypothetical protein
LGCLSGRTATSERYKAAKKAKIRIGSDRSKSAPNRFLAVFRHFAQDNAVFGGPRHPSMIWQYKSLLPEELEIPNHEDITFMTAQPR